ncbi:spermidine synthase [Devosia sp. A449]
MILLERIRSDAGDIQILKTKLHRSLVYQQGGCCQSEADADGISLCSYVHGIFGLLAQSPPHNVLMIGCGGGSLATMLASKGVQVSIVDVNPLAFDIARRYFNLPDEVACHVADGRDFLRDNPARYDAIVMDAYVGAFVPQHLRSMSFFRLAHTRLDEAKGRLIANVFTEHDFDEAPDVAATAMGEVWDNVRVLDIRGRQHRNALVMAGQVMALQEPELLLRPMAGITEILHDINRWRFRKWRLRGRDDRSVSALPNI